MATSSASLDQSPGSNWVQETEKKTGKGLPPGVRKVARKLKQLHPEWSLSRCIATAISMSKKWAAGGSAKGARNVAGWEALKGANKARQVAASNPALDGLIVALSTSYGPGTVSEQWLDLAEPVHHRVHSAVFDLATPADLVEWLDLAERRVRTPAGVKRFNKPVGSIITRGVRGPKVRTGADYVRSATKSQATRNAKADTAADKFADLNVNQRSTVAAKGTPSQLAALQGGLDRRIAAARASGDSARADRLTGARAAVVAARPKPKPKKGDAAPAKADAGATDPRLAKLTPAQRDAVLAARAKKAAQQDAGTPAAAPQARGQSDLREIPREQLQKRIEGADKILQKTPDNAGAKALRDRLTAEGRRRDTQAVFERGQQDQQARAERLQAAKLKAAKGRQTGYQTPQQRVDAMSDGVVTGRAQEERRRMAAGEPPVSAETRDAVLARADMLERAGRAPKPDREMQLLADAMRKSEAAGPRAPKTSGEHPVMADIRKQIAGARQRAKNDRTAKAMGLPGADGGRPQPDMSNVQNLSDADLDKRLEQAKVDLRRAFENDPKRSSQSFKDAKMNADVVAAEKRRRNDGPQKPATPAPPPPDVSDPQSLSDAELDKALDQAKVRLRAAFEADPKRSGQDFKDAQTHAAAIAGEKNRRNIAAQATRRQPAGSAAPAKETPAARIAAYREMQAGAATPALAQLANKVTKQTGRRRDETLKAQDPATLQALDQEMTRRSDAIGRPGQMSPTHQAVRAELASRQPAEAKNTPTVDDLVRNMGDTYNRQTPLRERVAGLDDQQRTALRGDINKELQDLYDLPGFNVAGAEGTRASRLEALDDELKRPAGTPEIGALARMNAGARADAVRALTPEQRAEVSRENTAAVDQLRSRKRTGEQAELTRQERLAETLQGKDPAVSKPAPAKPSTGVTSGVTAGGLPTRAIPLGGPNGPEGGARKRGVPVGGTGMPMPAATGRSARVPSKTDPMPGATAAEREAEIARQEKILRDSPNLLEHKWARDRIQDIRAHGITVDPAVAAREEEARRSAADPNRFNSWRSEPAPAVAPPTSSTPEQLTRAIAARERAGQGDDEVSQRMRESLAQRSTPAGISPARRAELEQLAQDYAGQYGGPNAPGGPGADNAARYIAEGHANANREEWDYLASYIQANPELLNRKPPTSDELAARRAARKAEATRLANEAQAAFKADDFDRADALISKAAESDPGRPWDKLRGLVAEGRAKKSAGPAPSRTAEPPALNLDQVAAERGQLADQILKPIDPRTVSGTPENITARQQARAAAVAQPSMFAGEEDQRMTEVQVRRAVGATGSLFDDRPEEAAAVAQMSPRRRQPDAPATATVRAAEAEAQRARQRLGQTPKQTAQRAAHEQVLNELGAPSVGDPLARSELIRMRSEIRDQLKRFSQFPTMKTKADQWSKQLKAVEYRIKQIDGAAAPTVRS